MHDRRPQSTPNQRRGQATTRDHLISGLDRWATTPSTWFSPRSLVPALGAVAVLGTLAACGTGASAARPAPIRTAVTSTTSATPTTAATATSATAPMTAANPTTTVAPAPVATSTTIARPAAPVDELAAVEGARMHIRCVGSGATTVLLIAGFNDAGDSWGAVEGPLAQDARVCSSSHLGTGTSDPAPGVQTFSSQASQLHTALQSVSEPGPYVLVGHSFGGAEAVAFASMFPDQVTGLMLLDASPTTWPDAVCAVPEDGSAVAQIFHDSCTLDYHPDGNAERLDVPAAFAEVAGITSLGSVPMVVVTADTHPYAGLDATEEAHLDEVWNEGQQQWAALSSTGHVVPVGNTSHHIQVDQPAIVVEQIRNLSR